VLSRGKIRRVRSPTLRVQAPLYRQGPGYSMSSGCSAAGFPVAAALAWALLLSAPLSGRKLLYKAPLPLDRHIRGICPRLASDLFVEKGFAWCGWWRSCVAGVTPLSSLCRSCWDPATFNKAMVKGFVVFASLGLRWKRSQPAAGAACSLVEAGRFAGCHGEPWDVSRQVVLPLAYPDSHPHDTMCASSQSETSTITHRYATAAKCAFVFISRA
jgi:uncharacterized protein (TIGR03382 family)